MAAVVQYEWLPTTFTNVVVNYQEIGSGFVATVRSSAANREDLVSARLRGQDKNTMGSATNLPRCAETGVQN